MTLPTDELWRRPVWARERCGISPPRFLAEWCKRQLNQGSFVLLYFRLFTFYDLYWVCLSVFSCIVLFVSISQVIGCEDRLRNDLYCVEWGVKLYFNQPTSSGAGGRLRSIAGMRRQQYIYIDWSLRPELLQTSCTALRLSIAGRTDTRPIHRRILYTLRPACSGSSTLEPGGGHKSWLGPRFSRTLDTLWSVESQKN